MGLLPYRTNAGVEAAVRRLFTHPHFKWRAHFIDVADSGSHGLVKDMACTLVACVRYYHENQGQFGKDGLDNIQWQALIMMWRQTYKHQKMQGRVIDMYRSTKVRLLSIDVGIWDTALECVLKKDFHKTDAGMRKHSNKARYGGLTQAQRPLVEGDSWFEYMAASE